VWKRAKAVSAGSSILIAVMAYLRDERVECGGATDMEQDKRSKRANLKLSAFFAKMEEFFASPSSPSLQNCLVHTALN
jgi:hypothetical protein